MKRAEAKKKFSESPFSQRAALLVLILIIVLSVFLFPKVTKLLVGSYLSKTTGLPVQIGNLDFSPAQLQFSIKEVQFLNPKDFPPALLAQIDEIKVRYSLPAALLAGFDLKRLEIYFREFRLVRNEKGNLNLSKVNIFMKKGDAIDELVLNLGPLTYTDLSEGQPVQKTFDLGLGNAVYRNVKGVAGIIEILNWEILKRTGVEEANLPPLPEIKAIAGSQAAGQAATPPAQILPLPSNPPSSESSAQEVGSSKGSSSKSD